MVDVAPSPEHSRYPQPLVGGHSLTTLERNIAPLVPDLSQSEIYRDEAAPLLDGLAIRMARGRTAVDLAIGDVLAALAQGDRTLCLGYSNIGDYARERLNISTRTAQQMARLSRELVERPILKRAVLDGKVSPLRAGIVAPVAHGEQEAFWTALATSRKVTVRHLNVRVRQARNSPVPTQDLWEQLDLDMSLEERELVEEALRLARKSAKKNMPRWQCIEAICQEFLGSFPQFCGSLDVERAKELMSRHAPEAECDESQREVEWFTNLWDFLDRSPPTVTALRVESQIDPFELDAQLRELARMRIRWDIQLGRLGFMILHYGLWRDMMFTSYDHYCRERLGLTGSAMRRRAQLERRFWFVPELKRALANRRINYSKATLLSRLPYTNIEPEIDWAENHTCLELQQQVDRDREALAAEFLPSGSAGRNTISEAFPCRAEAKADGVLDDTGIWKVVRPPLDDDEPEEEDAGGPPDEGGEMFASASDGTSTATPADEGGEMFAPPANPNLSRNIGFRLSLPESAITIVAEAILAAVDMAKEVGHPVGPGTALALIACHFIDICRSHKVADRGKRDRIIERTHGRCAVPVCSRGSAHLHHMVYRSHCGDNTTQNLIALCAGHHQRGLHAGRMRVSGNADDVLVWELGLKNGVPLETHRTHMPSANR